MIDVMHQIIFFASELSRVPFFLDFNSLSYIILLWSHVAWGSILDGNSLIKLTRMLIISLWVRDGGFWSQSGSSVFSSH